MGVREVAKQTGFCVATVSLALRNSPKISERTRRIVREKANALGYAPNPEVTRLMTQLRSQRASQNQSALGLISLWGPPLPRGAREHINLLIRCLETRALQLGFSLDILRLNEPGMTGRRLHEILLARGIEGVIVLGSPTWQKSIGMDLDPFAHTTLGYSIDINSDRVCEDQYKDMVKVMTKLTGLGYRRPALLLNADLEKRVFHHYSSAFLMYYYHHLKPASPAILVFDEFSPATFKSWMEKERPDALIIGQEPPSFEIILECLGEHRLSAPDDIGIAHLDLLEKMDTVSGIRQNRELLAHTAINRVVSQLYRGERGIADRPTVEFVEGSWIDGNTTRMM